MNKLNAILIVIMMTFLNISYANDVDDIKSVLQQQNKQWNQGNIEGFMQGYWNNENLRFASGKNITYGWQKTLDGYIKRYPDVSAMGQLTFELLEVNVYTTDDNHQKTATVFGKWKLNYTDLDKTPNGLFTLIFKKFNEDWKIISDHTSSE